MKQLSEKQLDEKIKTFLTSRKVKGFEQAGARSDKKHAAREKTSVVDWFIPTQLKAQW